MWNTRAHLLVGKTCHMIGRVRRLPPIQNPLHPCLIHSQYVDQSTLAPYAPSHALVITASVVRTPTSLPRLFHSSSCVEARFGSSSASSQSRSTREEDEYEYDLPPDYRPPFNHYKDRHLYERGEACRNPHYEDYLYEPVEDTRQSTKRFLWGLIGVNVLVWGCWTMAIAEEALRHAEMHRANPNAKLSLTITPGSLNAWMKQNFTASWQNVREGRVWTLVTSGFSHVGPLHLAFNMFVLYQITPRLLWRMGGVKGFMVAYVVGAAFGSLAHIFYQNVLSPLLGKKPRLRPQPDGTMALTFDQSAVGASGAICAFIVIDTFLHPKMKLSLMLIPIFIQAQYIIPIFFAGSLILSLLPEHLAAKIPSTFGGGEVSHWGHLGGAFFGLLYHRLFLRRGLPRTEFFLSIVHYAPNPKHFYPLFMRTPVNAYGQPVDQEYEDLILGRKSPFPPQPKPSWTPSSPSTAASSSSSSHPIQPFVPRTRPPAGSSTSSRTTPPRQPRKRNNEHRGG